MKKLALLLALVACGGEGTVVEVGPGPQQPQQLPAPPPPTATVQVQIAPVAQRMNAGENWIGRYRCAQGMTDLDLRIDAVNGNTIDATFIFAHGPSGAAGEYRMRGTIAPDGNLMLVPGAWVARPPNYVSVGMTGVVSGAEFRGRIDNPSCGVFIIRRSTEQ